MHLPSPPPEDDWPVDDWSVDTGIEAAPDSEDLHIESLVAQRLSIDWVTRCQQISVMVQNRVVILAGLVDTTVARQAAADLAWEVAGVYDVCNMLRLGRPRRYR